MNTIGNHHTRLIDVYPASMDQATGHLRSILGDPLTAWRTRRLIAEHPQAFTVFLRYVQRSAVPGPDLIKSYKARYVGTYRAWQDACTTLVGSLDHQAWICGQCVINADESWAHQSVLEHAWENLLHVYTVVNCGNQLHVFAPTWPRATQ